MHLFYPQDDQSLFNQVLRPRHALSIFSPALSLSLITLSGCMDITGSDLDPAESSGWERSGPGRGAEGTSTWDGPTDHSGAWTDQETSHGQSSAVVVGQSCGPNCVWSSYAIEVGAQRPEAACGDGHCACVVDGDVWSLCGGGTPSTGAPNGDVDESSCTLEVRSPDGRCDERCPQLDPDCGSSEGPASEPEVDQYDCPLEMRPDGECDLWCAHADPDCESSPDSQSPAPGSNTGSNTGGGGCTRDVVTPDGQCNQSCPDLDPDCGSSGSGSSGSGSSGSGSSGSGSSGSGSSGSDTDEYGCPLDIGRSDGQCNSWCADFDPDCGSSGSGSDSGGSGNSGGSEDSERADLCEQLNWYNDGECDEVCLRPDPDCG